MGNSSKLEIDVVVWIDSGSYHQYAYNQKGIFAGIVGQINQYYKGSGKKLMLISPGRIGTSSPELGVTVSFSDISNFSILCEYADTEIGFVPELSYGSHMFQDLVETEMFYTAIMDRKADANTIFHKQYWTKEASILGKILPAMQKYADGVSVYEMDETNALYLYADLKNRTVICGNFK
jgi:hypothetical protein